MNIKTLNLLWLYVVTLPSVAYFLFYTFKTRRAVGKAGLPTNEIKSYSAASVKKIRLSACWLIFVALIAIILDWLPRLVS
jgi:hypothetical protein